MTQGQTAPRWADRHRRAVAGIAVLGAGLATIAVASSAQPFPSQEQGLALQQDALINPLAELDLFGFTAFREKPLFSPARSIPTAPSEPALTVSEPADPALNVRLLGTIRGAEQSVATMRDLDSETTLSLTVGQMVGGWTLVAIDESSVLFEMGDENRELQLFSSEREPAATAAGSPTGTDAAVADSAAADDQSAFEAFFGSRPPVLFGGTGRP